MEQRLTEKLVEMDYDKLSVELDKLSLLQVTENENEMNPETWLFTPEEKTSNKGKDEEQNLEKWLRGAVDKVDYRTRSALSRKLEKKKRIKDKEKRRSRNNMESSLSMIEEVSGESGPLSDREQMHKRPREKENMAQRKCISEASIDSNDEDYDDEEDEDEEYFDAPSTPKKMPLAGRNPAAQQSSRKNINNNLRNGATTAGQSQTLARNIPPQSSSSAKNNTLTLPRNGSKGTQLQKASSIDEADFPKEWRNLSDIERRAREQERELQMELMKNRRDRAANNSNSGVSPRSRPNSASSSTSSAISGHGATVPHLATSKSVDFRSSTTIHNQTHANDQSSISVASSRSNEGSLADLSGASTSADQFGAQQLNSRLPLPRRPTIPGKTGIPLPAPKRVSRKLFTPSDSAAPMNDDECF